MPYDDVQKFSEAAVNKAKLLKEQPGEILSPLQSWPAFFIVVAMIFSNVVGNIVPEYRSCLGKTAWRYCVCHCGSADRFYRCRAFHRKQSCYGIWGLSTKKSPGHRLEKYGW